MGRSESAHNRQGLLFLLAAAGISLAAIAYFTFLRSEIDLGELEDGPAKAAAAASPLTEEERAAPWKTSSGLLEHGQKLYKTHCAHCHGPKGLGDGSPELTPPPRNLVEGKWSHGGSAQALFITLQKGVEGTSMISYRNLLAKEDRWALVHYIQSITQNKVSMEAQKLEEFGKTAL